MEKSEKADLLLHDFKGASYLHGVGVLSQVGATVAKTGQRPVLVTDSFPGSENYVQTIKESLMKWGRKGQVGFHRLENCARIVSAAIPLHPTQSNSSQSSGFSRTGFLFISQVVTEWHGRP